MIVYNSATGWKLKNNVNRIEIICVAIVDGELDDDRAGVAVDPAAFL